MRSNILNTDLQYPHIFQVFHFSIKMPHSFRTCLITVDIPATAKTLNTYARARERERETFTLEQATNAQRGVDIQLYSFFNLSTRWGGSSMAHPGCFTPRKEIQYPLYRRLGGPQGRSGRVQKISHPLGFDPQTIQPVASHYTDYIYIYTQEGG